MLSFPLFAALPVVLAWSIPNELVASRGGGADDWMVKIALAVAALHGTMNVFAPATSVRIYGLPADVKTMFTSRALGVAMLCVFAGPFAGLYGGASKATAVAVTSSIWLAELVRRLVENDAKTVGFRTSCTLFWMLPQAILVYAGLSDAGWIDLAYRAIGAFTVTSSLALTLAPLWTMKLYGVEDLSNGALMLTRGLGLWLTALGLYLAMLATDVSSVFLLKLCFLAGVATSADILFFSKWAEKCNIPTAPAWAWLLFSVMIVASAFMPDDKVEPVAQDSL